MALSTREKGARHERAVAHHLATQGYAVDRGFYKFSYLGGRVIPVVKDLLGAFDLIAIRPKHSLVRLIQVTAGGDVSARKKKALAVYPLAEVWEHRRGPRYRVHRRGGTEEVTIRPDARVLRPGASRG